MKNKEVGPVGTGLMLVYVTILGAVLLGTQGCGGPGENDDSRCQRPQLMTPDAVYDESVAQAPGIFVAQVYLTDESPSFKVAIPVCVDSTRIALTVHNREPGDPAELAVTASADYGAATGGHPMRSGAQEIEIPVRGQVIVELGMMTDGAIFSGDVTITVLQ
jgi:hypothetical protein